MSGRIEREMVRFSQSPPQLHLIRRLSSWAPTQEMSDENRRSHLEEDICVHIFTVSAAMIGVCLTVIGLIRVVISVGEVDTLADDLLATDAFVFLVACLLSYWALRTRSINRMHCVERLADSAFIIAMILMTAICGFITYAMTMAAK